MQIRVDSQTEVEAVELGTSDEPYMLRLLESMSRFLLRCIAQMRNDRQSGQNYSSGIRNSQTGGYRQLSVSPQISDPSLSRIHTDDACHDSQTDEGLSDSGLVESPNGTSIIGVRVVDGKPQIVWGFDTRNLPWA